MKKKLLIVSILAVIMLLAIAFASTVTSNISKTNRRESPLFGIRTRQAIRDKIEDLIKRFVGESVFFLPVQWIKNIENKMQKDFISSVEPTCYWTRCEGCTSQKNCSPKN